MELKLGRNFNITKSQIGCENAPLLIIDDFMDNAESLVEYGAERPFQRNSAMYPGVRSEAHVEYKKLFIDSLQDLLIEFFEISAFSLKFDICQYSIVTTPANRLQLLQRIPHFDSTDKNGLAAVHYLFKKQLGGTSFYRHKKTGYEYIDESRKIDYFRSLEGENGTGNIPSSGYINGDTPLYERIGQQEGVFNRAIVYRRNSLHSGSIGPDFVPDSNPLTGRLSINSFIDPV